MLMHFKHVWDGHLGCITTATHPIEMIDPTTRPVDSAPYRAEPKTREFEKLETKKMLGDNVLEAAQTEWAAPIVFAPKKDGTLWLLRRLPQAKHYHKARLLSHFHI